MNSNTSPTSSENAATHANAGKSPTSPAEVPHVKLTEKTAAGPILFFDGVCGLCNRFVDFALPRDGGQRIRFAPLQGETARELLKPEDITSLKTLVLVDERGVYRYSAAVVHVLRHFSLGWRVLAGLLWFIPAPIRNVGYKLVAANRYRLFGKKETCRLPSVQEKERFLP